LQVTVNSSFPVAGTTTVIGSNVYQILCLAVQGTNCEISDKMLQYNRIIEKYSHSGGEEHEFIRNYPHVFAGFLRKFPADHFPA
jgi:hypothetical protein